MTDEEQAAEERSYINGRRFAATQIMNECAKLLGYDDPLSKVAALISEREQTISKLRECCEDFGDNDWDDHLHLADVVDKHLHRVLLDNCEDDEEDDS